MLEKARKLPRILGTGFSFACLFGGGALIALFAFPVIAILSRDGAVARRRNQYVIHMVFRFYVWMIQVIRLVHIEVPDAATLKNCRSVMIIANHPTLLDVVVLMSFVRNARCIVKSALWSSRTLGKLVRAAGYIRNDLPSNELIEACHNCFQQGDNLIVFPEGTRTEPGTTPKMRRGFANIALFTEVDIQLVTITCAPTTLIKGEKWWHVPPVAPTLRVHSGDRLVVAKFMQDMERPLAARRLTQFVEDYYGREIGQIANLV